MVDRTSIPPSVQAKVLLRSRRRCCLCAYLADDWNEKSGQIAHVDKNRANAKLENLAFLCFDHHDRYDSKSKQSKGLTKAELREYRDRLYHAFKKGIFPRSTSSLRVAVSAAPTKLRGRPAIALRVENAGQRPVRIVGWYVSWGNRGKDRFIESCRGDFPFVLQEREERCPVAEMGEEDSFENVNEIGVTDSEGVRWPAHSRCMPLFSSAVEADRRMQHLKPTLPVEPTFESRFFSLTCSAESVPNAVAERQLRLRVENNGRTPASIKRVEIAWEYRPHRRAADTPKAAMEVGGAVGLPVLGPHTIEPGTAASVSVSRVSLQVAFSAAADDVPHDLVRLILTTVGGQKIALSDPSLKNSIVELAREHYRAS